MKPPGHDVLDDTTRTGVLWSALTALDYFEAIGFRLGQALAAARTRRRVVRSARPKGIPRASSPPTPAFAPGERVAFIQGGSVVVGRVLRVSPDGRVLVSREPDGKRVLKPASAVRGVTRLPPRRRRADGLANGGKAPSQTAARPPAVRPARR